jgi:hypothetical protein
MRMIRPWIGAALSVLALAAAPATAHAEAPAGPTIHLDTPADGAVYALDQPVQASYSCVDPDSPVTDCVGTVASGAAVDTSTAGSFTFTVTSHDQAGDVSTVTHGYAVQTEATGTTAATLTLTLGAPPAFSPFVPGVAMDYLAAGSAVIDSTAGDATLTVADPSAVAPGHLLNGDAPLPTALQAGATSPNGTSTGYQPVPDTADPATLVTYAGPLANEPVTLSFKQTIGQTDALRTGSYAKALVFTLSTTNP